MIYTVTFNPSLDYIVSVNNFQLGMTNRTATEMMLPGGKGINVSIVLKNLGLENTALGFVAGFTGDEIQRQVEEIGVNARFIPVDEGISRINLKLQNIEGTEINGQGPAISREKTQQLFEMLDQLQEGDVLVLAGSIPASMPDDIYRNILKRLDGKGILIAVDATGNLLVNVLEYHPFLVKPNNHELGEIFSVELKDRESVIPYAKKMQEMGATNVLVSMAGEGAVLAAADGKVYLAPAPKGKLVNGVGAGDSMVAGFIAGTETGKSPEDCFRLAVASGSATAYSYGLGEKELIYKLYNKITLKKEGV